MRTILIILIFQLFLVDSFSQEILVQVLHHKNDDNTAWTGGIDEITVRKNRKIITKLSTSSNGIVRIPRSKVNDGMNYDLSLTSIGIQENYLTTINSRSKDTILIMLPKHYKLRFGFAICPLCNKSNKVCKISLEPILVRSIVNGDTILSPIYKRTYYFGTDLWHEFNPNWYCKRDSIKF
jgi:hypothetical protein